MAKARCAEHDLGAGPDGLCALCRREGKTAPTRTGSRRAQPAEDEGSQNRTLVTFALAVVGLGALGGLVIWWVKPPAAPAELTAPAPVPLPAPPPRAPSRAGGIDRAVDGTARVGESVNLARATADFAAEEARMSTARRSVAVTLYAAPDCGEPCAEAAQWLRTLGVQATTAPPPEGRASPSFDVAGRPVASAAEGAVRAAIDAAAQRHLEGR